MIDSLSPWSRKLIAVSLLVLSMLLVVNLIIVPLAGAIGDSFDRLAQARQRVGRAQALREAPPPAEGDKVPASLVISARNRAAALASLQASLSAAAAAAGLPAPGLAPLSASDGDIGIAYDVRIDGRETDLVRFLASVEAENPAIRFERWTVIAPDAAGAPSHLQARARAVWRKGA